MIELVADLLGGLWTWQTPVSFLAGIGATKIYDACLDAYRRRPKEEQIHVQKEE
ncbi:hypothetical protein PBI_CATERA_79 [Mycobacterium phage Catera]|uniref:Uncharacterized protein n=3 Tax=Bixzunavirus Bxz1 TaxID=2006134 RepID=B5LKJ0_9CAUD|nr:hypothetical protein SCOTTMCG_77 [Mycobacterium phage ScottMcG]YP_002224334.1 gp80 [Mycobacterium phage Spud]YP_656092.1 gp79 [Mycobacterium phage Catera]QAY14348.1 hypothetical protein SEA_DARKO_81 [Mycobacterium phage Darko]ABE67832.1 hypothetical protein PBI_CATERA_79 [Mycobacterium phage Catera]ACH62537.1 hypothetical protein SPUD_80 [Mycobacterium phage Spud]ACH62756.1 hypothetical protein SCOTTMCG_77 [Mycobacterium phage ScottMcG]